MTCAASHPRGARGFSLVELMVAIAVLAALLVIGIPSFTTLLRQWRLDATIDAFVGDVRLARSTATRTSRPVVICPRNANACGTGTNWAGGWLVFSDLDGDGALDAGEPIIAQRGTQAGIASITGPAQLRFRNNGSLNGISAGVIVSVAGAPPGTPDIDIDINAIGRASVEPVKASDKKKGSPKPDAAPEKGGTSS